MINLDKETYQKTEKLSPNEKKDEKGVRKKSRSPSSSGWVKSVYQRPVDHDKEPNHSDYNPNAVHQNAQNFDKGKQEADSEEEDSEDDEDDNENK